MLAKILDNVKSAPEKLKEAPERLNRRRKNLELRARQRVLDARVGSEQTLWSLRTQTLERAEDLLEKAPEVPVIGTLADKAEGLVHGRLEAITAVSIEDYDSLNAKDIVAAVREIDSRVALFNVRRHEAANKNRKTVLKAVEDTLKKLSVVSAAA